MSGRGGHRRCGPLRCAAHEWNERREIAAFIEIEG